jgi:hypothetical protein
VFEGVVTYMLYIFSYGLVVYNSRAIFMLYIFSYIGDIYLYGFQKIQL